MNSRKRSPRSKFKRSRTKRSEILSCALMGSRDVEGQAFPDNTYTTEAAPQLVHPILVGQILRLLERQHSIPPTPLCQSLYDPNNLTKDERLKNAILTDVEYFSTGGQSTHSDGIQPRNTGEPQCSRAQRRERVPNFDFSHRVVESRGEHIKGIQQ